MKLDVIANGKRGVINITSEQFIIEDLKAHVCTKLNLNESDFKVKIHLGECPSMELVKQLSTFNRVEVFNRFDNHKKILESILSKQLNAKINLVESPNNSFLIFHESRKRIARIKRGEGSYYHAKANTPKNELDVIKNLFRLNTLLKYEDNEIKSP